MMTICIPDFEVMCEDITPCRSPAITMLNPFFFWRLRFEFSSNAITDVTLLHNSALEAQCMTCCWDIKHDSSD